MYMYHILVGDTNTLVINVLPVNSKYNIVL
jgi:hypothetical protein